MQLVQASRDLSGKGTVKSPLREHSDIDIKIPAGAVGIALPDGFVTFEHGRKNTATMQVGEGDITHVS